MQSFVSILAVGGMERMGWEAGISQVCRALWHSCCWWDGTDGRLSSAFSRFGLAQPRDSHISVDLAFCVTRFLIPFECYL